MFVYCINYCVVFIIVVCVCLRVLHCFMSIYDILFVFFRVFSVGVLVFNLFMPVFYDVGCMPNVLLLLISVHTCCHI